MEENYELDFDLLIRAAIDIGNRLDGQKNPSERETLVFAEGLGQKIIHHTLSVRFLFESYQFATDKHLFVKQVDFASIAILTRAALETYLTLNYVFVSPKNDEEKEFRFKCWHLAGFLDRAGFEPKEEEHIILKESERQSINKLTLEIQALTFFKALPKRNQDQALKGFWRLDNAWINLATQAGFSETFFRQQYKFLCGYAHSSRLSIIQIQQTKNIEQQKEMAKASISVLMIVIAKFMYDYIQIIPELKAVEEEFEAFPLISMWKMVGENL